MLDSRVHLGSIEKLCVSNKMAVYSALFGLPFIKMRL